jgi:hypothetical protein
MNAYKDVRISLKKMRQYFKGEVVTESSDQKTLLDMREMLKRSRKMNEFVTDKPTNLRPETNVNSQKNTIDFDVQDMTDVDKETQKKKIETAFQDQDVFVSIEEFKQYNNNDGDPIGFFLSGGIDGVITFDLKVAKTEEASGIDWTATPDFKEDQKNNEIIERLKSFYEQFYEEWRESLY